MRRPCLFYRLAEIDLQMEDAVLHESLCLQHWEEEGNAMRYEETKREYKAVKERLFLEQKRIEFDLIFYFERGAIAQ